MQDYRGPDVTAENFLSVLSGQEPTVIGTSGKVIKSGPEDRVFVFYADHGAPGVGNVRTYVTTMQQIHLALSQDLLLSVVSILPNLIWSCRLSGIPFITMCSCPMLTHTLNADISCRYLGHAKWAIPVCRSADGHPACKSSEQV